MNGHQPAAPVRESLTGASRYPAYPSGLGVGDTQDMGILTDPGKVPADRAAIPDDDLIGTEVWAVLQGITMKTFYGQRSRSQANRRNDAARPGDMPDADEHAGNAPLWYMRTYRAWEKRRPGKSSSLGKAGRGVRGGQGAGKPVRLPVECPHCKHQITAADLEAAEAGNRAKFAKLRESGVPAADAAARLGLDESVARSWEMARRRAGRSDALPEETVKRPAGRKRRAVKA